MWTVYQILNTVSGKQYIGLTGRPLRVRRSQHLAAMRAGTLHPLYNAMRKYGAEAFVFAELEVVATSQEASEVEMRWIAMHNTTDRIYGYNIRGGGFAGVMSEETRKLLSEKAKAREASLTAEQKTARAFKGLAGLPPDKRSEIARKREALKTPAQAEAKRHLVELARAAVKTRPRKQAVGKVLLSPEQRRQAILDREARKTPEQRSAAVAKGHMKRTHEQKQAAVIRMQIAKKMRREGEK